MEDSKTVLYVSDESENRQNGNMTVTIFDGDREPAAYRLNDFRKNEIYFGRSDTNDIVLTSKLVSREHGRFICKNGQWCIEDKVFYSDTGSGNGLIYNNRNTIVRNLCDGDLIRIDDKKETIAAGVLFVFSSSSGNAWKTRKLRGENEITIGRSDSCDIVLPHVSVSKCHAKIICIKGVHYLIDNGSTNGIIVNGVPVSGKRRLQEKDVITITNSKLIFTSAMIAYCCFKNGVSVDTDHVFITRGSGRKQFITGNDISVNIRPGELVAIIGGSGAGKSTILNCMCGYLPPSKGNVFINGVDLYRNFDSMKEMVGYVPQSDIVYDNLTLYDMLMYTAKLRLPKDTSPREREAAIDRAIETVELTEKKKSYIKSLSGGQRKRASIAVELLSDPNLLFLDEPASGLDPGTERTLMASLRDMANNGKTVILVTHSTLQLSMCDKIVFMGKGGNLCFFGSLEEAQEFFGINDIVDVYGMITDHAKKWRDKYDKSREDPHNNVDTRAESRAVKTRKGKQLPVLCSRYAKLVLNDHLRLLLLLVQAPVLALLISLVADGGQFEGYSTTKSLLFALSCSAFWVGMLNAIQEICKERGILKREYMTGLSLTSYLISKILVQGLLCLLQSFCIIAVFSLTVGLPEEGLFLPAFLELLITTFLTALASTATGLFVSSLFKNADRAMTVAPILLMPQILFSGLVFELDGAKEIISWFAVCRWSMEGYGTTANLNSLSLTVPDQIKEMGINELTHEAESFFEFTTSHMLFSWGILLAFVVVFLILARICLSKIGKESA